MSLGERVWDTFAAVIQMKDRIAALTDAVRSQQARVEDLTGRMIRLETALAMLMQQRRAIQAAAKQQLPAESDALKALDRLQKSLGLTENGARRWEKRARSERRASSRRLER